MSFFIRKQKKRESSLPSSLTDRANAQRKRNGLAANRKRKAPREDAPPKQVKHHEEITSESEVDEDVNLEPDQDSDNSETEQEARVRIAKEQIKELKRKVLEKQQDVDDNDVATLLRENELLEEGKVLRKVVPESYADKEVQLRVLIRGKVIKTPLTCVRATATHVYASTKSGVVVAFNLKTNARVRVTLTPPPVTSLAATESVVAAATGSAIHLLCPTTLKTTHTFSNSRNALSLQVATETLFSTHKDRTVKLWNIQERAYVESLFGHQDVPTCVDVLHSNRIVTSGGFDKTLRVWKIEEESQLVYNWDEDIIECVRVISGGFFVAGSCSGNLGLFSFGRKKPLHVVKEAHGVDSNSVPRWITSLGGVGDFVASGSDNGVVSVWKIVARKLEFVRNLNVPSGVVIGIEVNPDSDGVSVIVGIGTEMKNGRWGGRKSNCSNVVLIT